MEEEYRSWKQYIYENEDKLRTEDANLSSKEFYIVDTLVCLYSGKAVFSACMWLQSEERQIRIYSRNEDYEKIIWRTFAEGQESGPLHQHDFIEIGYVVEGCACQSFFGKDYRFKEGDFWLVDRHCFHSDKYSLENLFTVYIGIPSDVFDAAFVESVGNTEIQKFLSLALLEQKKTRQFLHFKPRRKETDGGKLMEKLLREIVEQKVGFYNISKGMLARLLRSLSIDYDFMITSQEKQKVNDVLYVEIEKFINENFRTVTIQQLVEHFHYNEDYYNRLIKKYSGYTYSEYIKNVRLKEAEKLLNNTELSVGDIAEQVGYDNRANFYRLFVRKYGLTPAKYRKIKETD